MPSETLEALKLNLNYPGEIDGDSKSVAVLTGRMKRDSPLMVLRRSIDSADRVIRIQLPPVHVRQDAGGEWERDPRCPKRHKENCANGGEWMLAMRRDVERGMRV